ncbi:MAG: ammonium transporter, partial [Selenomonadaceae bacterium]|nr:ammonium transporter [Selenomonadaceae bacterium]
SIVVAIVFAVVGSTILFKLVSSFTEIRADEDEEVAGLDLVEHGERGYTVGLFTGAPSFLGVEESNESTVFTSKPVH